MNNIFKNPITISYIALFISTLSLLYGVSSNEFGVLIGKNDPQIEEIEKMVFYNSLNCLTLHPKITVHNNGTRMLKVKRIEVFIKLDKEEHRFKSHFPFTIGPNNVFSEIIKFSEILKDNETLDRDKLEMVIVTELLNTYHSKLNNSIPITLSDSTYNKAKKMLSKNVDWLHTDDEYSVLIMFWLNDDDFHPSKMFLYRAKIDDFHRKALTELQTKSYKTPFPNLINSNLFIFFYAYSELTLIKENHKKSTMYDSYKQHVVAKRK